MLMNEMGNILSTKLLRCQYKMNSYIIKRKRTVNKTSIKLHDGMPASEPTGWRLRRQRGKRSKHGEHGRRGATHSCAAMEWE